MASTKKDETPKEGSTAHQSVPGDVEVTGAPGDGAMPMGMLGGAAGETDGDPDQKSTHVPPKTVESTLPDGSPKYMDPPSKPAKKKAAASGTAKYETVGRVIIAETDEDGEKRTRTVEPGEVIELDAKTAESLGENLKPAS